MKKPLISIQEKCLQQTVDELAFMVHEAYQNSNAWNNDLFLLTYQKHFRDLNDNSESLSYDPHKEAYKATTTLGDVFEYDTLNWTKKVNDKIVWGELSGKTYNRHGGYKL